VSGFFLAVGFGGHGFQHSPATGRHVAAWIVDGKPAMDLSLFDPQRFKDRGAGSGATPSSLRPPTANEHTALRYRSPDAE
jgi:hypothetical protein